MGVPKLGGTYERGYIGDIGFRFPKIRGTFSRVPIKRTMAFWGPLLLGNYHLKVSEDRETVALPERFHRAVVEKALMLSPGPDNERS